TVLIWAMLAALGIPGLSPRLNAVLIILTLTLLPLAKLPGAVFWPLVALIYIHRSRQQGAFPLIIVGVAALITYALTCAQYHIHWLHPLAGIKSIRSDFRHLSASPSEVFNWHSSHILLNRFVLGLTLPGLLFAGAGIMMLSSHFR